jgi:hypothetical protein
VGEGTPRDGAEAKEEESSNEWREPSEEMPVVAAGCRLNMVAASLALLALT